MAPQLAPQADSFEWPALETEARARPKVAGEGRRSRRPLAIGHRPARADRCRHRRRRHADGGGNSSGLSTVTSSSTLDADHDDAHRRRRQPLLPDPAVPAARRPRSFGAGGTLFATTPGGRVARLNGRSLRQLAIASDAPRPRALAVLGRTLIVADDKTLYRLRARHARTGRGVGVRPGARASAAEGRCRSSPRPADALCLVGASGPGPCVRASFVADRGRRAPGRHRARGRRARGALATFRRAGKKLVASGSRDRRRQAGARPGRRRGIAAYVPVSRGLAVVDLATRVR